MGYDPYNAAFEYWHQFVWVKDFLLAGYENVNFNQENSEYYCMSIPIFLKCYLVDFFKTAIYLSVLIVLCLVNFKNINDKSKNLHKDVLLKLFLIFSVSFIFWSFIGWYPPLRFNLYSFGSFLTLLFCLQFALLNDGRVKTISILSYVLYFISLNRIKLKSILEYSSKL